MSVAQEYLDRIDEMLASYDEVTADSLVKEVCSAFAGTIPEIKTGLDRYRARISVGGQQVTYDNTGDLMKLRSKLRLYVEKSEPTKSGNPVSGFFNLVVGADADNPMPGSRMLETLAPDARDLVMPGGSIDMAALCALPTVITPEFAEDDSQAQAVVGYLDGTSRAPAISRPVMTVPSRALLDRGVVSGGWLGERTRWDVLEGDPFKLLAGCCTVLSTAQPSDGESACVDPHLVAVMMPFRAEPVLDNVYKAITEGASSAGFHCKRVDEMLAPADITDDIVALIERSSVVVADISGLNANVMFEYGYARGRGKPVILVSGGDLSALPFDIRQQRTFQYRETVAELRSLSGKIAGALSSLG